MKKIFYLSTCSTCSRIINELSLKNQGFEFQDIKTEKITAQQLEQMAEMAGSYEALFSRVALKYKTLGLAQKTLNENDYKNYILEEYTLLKRPVIIIDNSIYVGNSKSIITAAQTKLQTA
jgi:arsenate reductase (glutaredoxin)